MKNLKDISELVTKFKSIKNFFLEGSPYFKKDSAMIKLHDGIFKGAYENDEQAALDIYQRKPTDKSYQMLKGRYREYLLNMLFQIDAKRKIKSIYGRTLFQCTKNLMAAQILIMQGKRETAMSLLKQTLRQAQQFQLSEIKLSCARMLRYHSSFRGAKEEMTYYNRILNKTQADLQDELLSDELSEVLIVEFTKSKSNKDELKRQANTYFKKLKSIAEKSDSYTVHLNMYRVGIRYYHINHDHRNVIKLSNAGEKYMRKFPHLLLNSRLAEMALYKMDSCLYLRDYKNGNKYAQECRQLFNPGQYNWIIFLEYYFLLCLHTKNYSEAQDNFNQVSSHPNFKVFPAERIEKWRIYEAYLFYIMSGNPENKKFNLSKFLNEVPIYSKDKRGYNLSIYIGQIILLIQLGEIGKVLDNLQALKYYFNRYVRKVHNHRTYYFIKMLLTLMQYDFDLPKTKEIANKYFEKMQQINQHYTGDLESVEIIPYEHLWESLIQNLERLEAKERESY